MRKIQKTLLRKREMAGMNLTIFDESEKAFAEELKIDPTSLYSAFEQIPDGRKKKGKRYPLPFLLTLLLLGKLAGETTINGIVDWVKERKVLLKQQLSWPKRFPVNSTYSQALAQCDAQAIVTAIAQVILKARAIEKCETEPSRLLAWQENGENLLHTAMDGKVLRGTLGHASEEQPSVHLLSLYECESGLVIAQAAVKNKENEISGSAAFLHPLLVKGRIISTDAMHTQKKWFAAIHGYGGYYLSIAKKNQPTVHQDLLDFFADRQLDQGEWEHHRQVQKGHGRLEVREIWSSRQMNEWFEKEWTGVAQIFKIRRAVTTWDTEREEIVYGLTNLPRKKASAKRLLDLNQRHWLIENRLHYRRDVTLGEDACQVRIKGAPLALAALNGGILALMDWLNVTNVASQMRHFCAQPHEALQLLIDRLSR
jgi:predicted transposase YbfD/YdcC